MTDKNCAGMELIGVEIGSYRITELLGTGGMGAVFRATHKSLNLQVAIKVMLPPGQLVDRPTEVQRFLQEAKALSEVEHSSLVKLYDVGTLSDGKIYMQMELLHGETLEARLKRLGGPLALESAVELARQMASALQVVHERGIVHRDLKPHNVIVGADREAAGHERAKLLDFGIAKFLGGTAKMTATGQPIGTPRYMSPEQCESSPLINEQTDVYSLGLLLFEMATGQSPYPLEDDQPLPWLYAQVERRPRTLRQLRPEAPAALEALVSAMLDKLPRQRPTMSEVESQLRQCGQFLGGSNSAIVPSIRQPPLPIADAQAVPGSTQAARRRRWLLWGAAGGLGLLGLGVTLTALTYSATEHGSWWQSLPARLSLRSASNHNELSDVDAAIAAARAPVGMAFIPGRIFIMGSTPEEIDAAYKDCSQIDKECEREEFERELPQRAVTVHSFYLDKNEVTNRQFADWLNRPLVQPAIDRSGRMVSGRNGALLADLHPEHGGIELVGGKYKPRANAEDLPVAQVTWHGARQYCETLGKSLPTEAQWELAAHADQRTALQSRWPWGAEPPRCDGVVVARARKGACQRPNPGPEPVGQAPQDVTPQGVHDLGGNVREWVLDVFAVPYPDCGTCKDPVVQAVHPGVQGSGYRVVRGGNWFLNPIRARSAARGRNDEDGVSPSIGFRCAASVVR